VAARSRSKNGVASLAYPGNEPQRGRTARDNVYRCERFRNDIHHVVMIPEQKFRILKTHL
jgi:hypothetical protein